MKKFAQTVIEDGAFYTIAAPNGRVLEVADYSTENGAAIRLWSYEGQPWQQWTFTEAGEGIYRIQNRFTKKVIDLAMGGRQNGTWLHQWTAGAGKSQHWQLQPGENGRMKLYNVTAKKVVDLVDMRIDNGAQAQIWEDIGGENQLWRIEPVPARQLKEVVAPPVKTGAPKSTRTQTGRGSRAKKTVDARPAPTKKGKGRS